MRRHGDYPKDELGRSLYPQRYFFEQIAGVFADAGKSVPVYAPPTPLKAAPATTLFCLAGLPPFVDRCAMAGRYTDKHFSYCIDDALWMMQRADSLSIPMLAGT